MVTTPKGDIVIHFDRGGVAISKLPASIYIVFFTSLNRMLTETGIQKYTLDEKDINDKIERCWKMAAEFCPAKVFSRPDDENVSKIVDAMKGLLQNG